MDKGTKLNDNLNRETSVRSATSTHLKFVFIVLMTFSDLAKSAPFDKTGLIDLKSEATARASCAIVGNQMSFAVRQLQTQLMKIPAKTQDELIKKKRAAERYMELSETGDALDRALTDSAQQHLPPSQRNEYFQLRGNSTAVSKIQKIATSNPELVVSALESCLKQYGFR